MPRTAFLRLPRALPSLLALAAITACSASVASSGGLPAPDDDSRGIAAVGDVLTRPQIDRIHASNMKELLEGRFTGLLVQSSGAWPRLVMRGSTDPLIVIDGVPQRDAQPLWTLNPRDIEQIRLVKNAETSLYGVRGADGVVEVTTRFR